MRNSFFRITAITLTLAMLGLGCKGTSEEVASRYKPVTLTYWRMFDDSDDFAEIIAAYRQSHPNIQIQYKKFRPEEYEKALLEAFAEDRGPDLFTVHNTWVGAYANKILPMPANIEIPKMTMEGTIKKEPKVILESYKTPSINAFKKIFVDVVSTDAVRDVAVGTKGNQFEKKVLGVPFSVDTLAMFYNNDLLAQAGIATPPKYWDELQNAVKLITKVNKDDTIAQSGAALGTAININRAGDIVSLLMMQNGTRMADDFGRATFNSTPPELVKQREVSPGIEALMVYTEFANPLETIYTWNSKLPESFEAFADGKTAFFFGYNYHIELLAARAPKLNYSISPVLQPRGDASVNMASYYLETVSKKTKYPNETWDFLLFATTRKENTQKYLAKTKRPTALRELIDVQIKDEQIPQRIPFAQQLLTAKSWYRGKDSAAMEAIMRDMIEEALANAPIDPREAFENAINRAVNRVNQTL